MSRTHGVKRPLSLRQPGLKLAVGLTSALISTAAMAQSAEPGEAEDLGVAEYKDYTADSNPYTSKGAPYKARVSADPRRVKPLAETPATITVVTEKQIEEAATTDLKEIVRLQPGVTIGTGENGNAFGDRYIIRGEEARSDTFVDGLRDPGMTTRESFAVDQVEITKGPSATFAGRGATGGSVNAITKQASTDYSFNKVDLGVGTDNFWRGTIDSNLAISENAAIRANLLYADQDVPDRDPARRKRWGAAVSGKLNIGPSVNVVLDYYHLTAKDKPDLGSYVPLSTANGYGKPFDNLPAFTQDNDFLNSKVDTVTGRITIEAMDGLKIVNSTRYGESHNGYVTTGARGDSVGALIALDDHQGWQDVTYFVNQFNVIGQFDTGSIKHNLVVGSEYSDHKVVNGVYSLTKTGATNCTTTRGAAYCLTDASGNQIVADGDVSSLLGRKITKGGWDSNWHMRTLSFYAMDTVDLTRWLTVSGGVRMDAIDFTLLTQSPTATPLVVTSYNLNDTLWNGHLSVSVKPTEELMIYASWATAKNVNGGESDLGANCGYGGACTATGYDFGSSQPESSTNWEAGIKWDVMEDKLLLTAAAFQTTKDKVFEGTGYSTIGTMNSGKTRVKGIELGLVGNITSRLSGQIGGTIMDSEMLKSVTAANVGLDLANFAKYQATGQLRYQATDAFAFGVTGTYKSAMYAGQPDSAAAYNAAAGRYSYRIPSSTVFDAFAEYKFNSHLSARVNVQNIGDVDYYTAGYRSGAFLYKGDERRGTLTVTGRF